MALKEMQFKGKRVYVEVDGDGSLILEDGRARMTYKPGSSQIYRPNPANLSELDAERARPEASPKQSRTARGARALPGKEAPAGNEAIVAYTDGACIGNPGPAGIGYVINLPDGTRIARGEPLGAATNNIAELTAILKVLGFAEDRSRPLVIHTDSEYAIGVLCLGWKAKANRELIGLIRRRLSGFEKVSLRKVKGHAGVPDNELVDELARKAAERQIAVDAPD